MFATPTNGRAPIEHDTPVLTTNRAADPTPVELGHRIKLIRIGRGLTLKDVEHRGGISATHVSEIERGKASPTIGVLVRLGRALDVAPATLIEPKLRPEVSTSKPDERLKQRMRWGNATIDPLTAPIDNAAFGVYRLTIPVGADAALAHQHPGEEWVMVVSGQAEIRTEGQAHVLREGDTLHFHADRDHAYANPASTPAVLLIATRPRFVL